jgi:hypothetical protein
MVSHFPSIRNKFTSIGWVFARGALGIRLQIRSALLPLKEATGWPIRSRVTRSSYWASLQCQQRLIRSNVFEIGTVEGMWERRSVQSHHGDEQHILGQPQVPLSGLTCLSFGSRKPQLTPLHRNGSIR